MISSYTCSAPMSFPATPFELPGNANSRTAQATSIPWASIINLDNMHMNTQGMRDSLKAQMENDDRILTVVKMALTSARLRLAASRTNAANSMQFLRMAEGQYRHAIQTTRYLDHIETSLTRVGNQSSYRIEELPDDSIREAIALRNALARLQSAKRKSVDNARDHAREADAVVLADTNEVIRLEHIENGLQDSISSKQSLIDSL
jgi:hypothetical protein